MRRALLIGFLAIFGCTPATPAKAPRTRDSALAYLRHSLVAYPAGSDSRLALTDPLSGRVAIYDAALVSLVLLRSGRRDEAARVLEGLATLQAADGSLPFSFVLPRPDESVPYVRAGAVAWVGYAAAEYLDSDSAGPSRAVALRLARGAARYLGGRIVTAKGDARDGLLRGGSGALRYEVDSRGAIRERIESEEIEWASVEHNVDAFFFFRALSRVTGEGAYAETARSIAAALRRAWDGESGQLVRGFSNAGRDELPTLDCASWGALFLGAVGAREEAETAASVADAGFATEDAGSGARGHRMQRRGPVIEPAVLVRALGSTLPVRDWSQLDAVWPEGSAGVALASLRVGRITRARSILDALEPLRAADGSLPTSTIAVPYLFDTRPSIAGTAWVELVRFEISRPVDHPTFWVP